MSFPPVRAVFFDAYGTIFDVHAPVTRLAEEIGPNAGAISELWRQKQLQYTWLRSLMGAYVDFAQVTVEALDYALTRYNVDNAALREKLLRAYLAVDAYPDAADALKSLRERNIITGILSNGSPGMLQHAVGSAMLGDVLDHVLSVDEVGIYKPHPSVYELVERRLGMARDAVAFVSANAWDAAGAAHFGFPVIHLNRSGDPFDNLPGAPLLTVRSLAEVAASIY
jgi:2-haloacid dehalogenase